MPEDTPITSPPPRPSHPNLGKLLAFLALVLGLGVWFFWPKKPHSTRIPLSSGKFDHSYVAWAGLLKGKVKEGSVDYSAFKKEASTLGRLKQKLGAASPVAYQNWPDGQKKAFFLNLYHVSAIHLIASEGPVDSVSSLRKGFKTGLNVPCLTLWGRELSLNELENEWLTKFNDPRIKFALCKGTKDGPLQLDQPYTAGKLEAQLEAQAKRGKSSDGTGPLNGEFK